MCLTGGINSLARDRPSCWLWSSRRRQTTPWIGHCIHVPPPRPARPPDAARTETERDGEVTTMSTKARRNRSRKSRAKARTARSSSGSVVAESLTSSTPSPIGSVEALATGGEAHVHPDPWRPDSTRPSAPSVGDLDAHFFDSPSSEAWLAHELELRDPRFVQKMTAGVARRRARFARYVVGVVALAAALGLVALLKSAVVPRGGEPDPRPHRSAPVGKATLGNPG